MTNNVTDIWAVIKNPTSGFRSKNKDWQTIVARMKDYGIEYILYETEFAGHAIELTRKILDEGYRRLLVVGGDGTLNEVVNGIMTSQICNSIDVTLALLPHGTGNDWGRYWGMKRGETDIAKIINNGRIVVVDICMLSFGANGKSYSRYFINGIGFGLDAKVCLITNKLKDIFGGHHWLYTFALLFSVFTHKVRKCTISDCNGKTEKMFLFSASIGNACYSGGGLKQTDGIPTDGLLFGTFIKRLTFTNIVKGFSALFSGKLWEAPFCEVFITDKLHIETERSLLMETDGVMVDAREITRQTGKEINEYDIKLMPSRIRMLIP